MRKYKLNENLLTIIENGREIVIDLDRLFPSPYIKYNDRTKTPQNEYVNRPTPLEALERLRFGKASSSDISLIKRELKRLEELDNDMTKIDDILSSKLKVMNGLLFTLEETCKKQNEVLRIIKEKEVAIQYLKESETEEIYNQWTWFVNKESLTKEEFDLLKEWLK